MLRRLCVQWRHWTDAPRFCTLFTTASVADSPE